MSDLSSSSSSGTPIAPSNVDVDFMAISKESADDLNICLQQLWDSLNNDHHDKITIGVGKVTTGPAEEAKQQEQISHFMNKWRALPDSDKSNYDYLPAAWPQDIATLITTILDKCHNKDSITYVFQWVYGVEHTPSTKSAMIDQMVKDKIWPFTHVMLRNILSHQHHMILQQSEPATIVPPVRRFTFSAPVTVPSKSAAAVLQVPVAIPPSSTTAPAFVRVMIPKPCLFTPITVTFPLRPRQRCYARLRYCIPHDNTVPWHPYALTYFMSSYPLS
jgi:hypothetical protein